MQPRKTDSIVYLSTYPPRECGVATFTKDLVEAVQKKYNPALKPKVLAINSDITDIYSYEKQVIKHIAAENIEDYTRLAQEVNQDPDIKLVHIQHEFGLFGGNWGDYLIPFFQIVEKPVVVTLHTVLPDPNRTVLRLVQLILGHSKAVIVMNKLSKETLVAEYGAPGEKVHVIPHGIPYVASPNGQPEKERLGVQDRLVLSTFGLLSPGKGIEYALRALPPLVKRYPNLLYLVIGVTHPIVRKHEGEAYRNSLLLEVKRLGLENHVRFYNKYLALDEITSFLRASDIYVSPSLDPNQAVSGTLSYALGCGTPVVCTNSLYAQSLVTPNIGVLVNPKDSRAITKALRELCSDPRRAQEMGKTAFAETRHMTWPNIAFAHFQLYQKVAPLYDEQKLPTLTLAHLANLTDSFGIIQFAKHTEPDLRYGYTLDDNARALIVAADAAKQQYPGALELLGIYLRFVRFVQKPNGSFANLVQTTRKIPRQPVSDDTQGRALWGLGYICSQNHVPADIRKDAKRIFQKALPTAEHLESSRAIAFAIIGLHWFLQENSSAKARKLLETLAAQQLKRFSETSGSEWLWFENNLTYSNSKLSESLFYAYAATKKKAYLSCAEKSLGFLLETTFSQGYFSPIGQNGWYLRNGKRAYFDQQPEDASSMTQTLAVAWRITRQERYLKLTQDTFQWFLGKNHLKQMVYDETTGGCYDGLGQQTVNLNQGAESTISYLLARLDMEKL